MLALLQQISLLIGGKMRLQLNFVLNVLKQISMLTFATNGVCFKMLDNKMGVEEYANLLDNQKKYLDKKVFYFDMLYTLCCL